MRARVRGSGGEPWQHRLRLLRGEPRHLLGRRRGGRLLRRVHREHVGHARDGARRVRRKDPRRLVVRAHTDGDRSVDHVSASSRREDPARSGGRSLPEPTRDESARPRDRLPRGGRPGDHRRGHRRARHGDRTGVPHQHRCPGERLRHPSVRRRQERAHERDAAPADVRVGHELRRRRRLPRGRCPSQHAVPRDRRAAGRNDGDDQPDRERRRRHRRRRGHQGHGDHVQPRARTGAAARARDDRRAPAVDAISRGQPHRVERPGRRLGRQDEPRDDRVLRRLRSPADPADPRARQRVRRRAVSQSLRRRRGGAAVAHRRRGRRYRAHVGPGRRRPARRRRSRAVRSWSSCRTGRSS